MNKLTKGTIAVGAAVLLLVGGGGTLAYWNSTAEIADAGITSGQLTATTEAGAWTVKHQNAAEATNIPAMADYRAVPGDQLTYTTKVTVVASGTNLKFEATLGNGSITAASADDADVKLAAILTAGATYSLSSTDARVTITDGVATIANAVGTSGTYVLDVAVTITWPFDEGADSPATDNPAQQGSVTLEDLTLLVEQV